MITTTNIATKTKQILYSAQRKARAPALIVLYTLMSSSSYAEVLTTISGFRL